MEKALIQSVAEYEHLNEMHDELHKKLLESTKRESAKRSTLRGPILGYVVAENYEKARDELDGYVASKTAYPGFQNRVGRLIQHCKELTQAIDTKRNFPGLATLSLSKQQEIHEKVIEHFEELKHHLRQIEMIEREHKLDDVRSTVWVLRSLSYGVGAMVLIAFLLDIRDGDFNALFEVTNSYLDSVANWAIGFLKF